MNATAVTSLHPIMRALPRAGWQLDEDGASTTMALPVPLGEAVAVYVVAACLPADLWRIGLLDANDMEIPTDAGTFRHPCEAMAWAELETERFIARDRNEPWASGLTTIFDTED